MDKFILILLLLFISIGYSRNIDIIIINDDISEMRSIKIITDKEDIPVGEIKANSRDTVKLQNVDVSIISVDYTDAATNPNEIFIECIENEKIDCIVTVNLTSSVVTCIIKDDKEHLAD